MHIDDCIPLVFGHVDEHAISQNSCVVDDCMQVTEGVDRLSNHSPCTIKVGDIVTIHNSFATHRDDLVDNRLCWSEFATGTVDRSTKIIHHDLCSLTGKA